MPGGMNGLVAYDSSSDEDDAAVRSGQPDKVGASERIPLNGVTSTSKVLSAPEHQSSADDASVANIQGDTLIGPELLDGFANAHEGSSEQDLIRHLTQATHPMSSIPESPPGSPDAGANARIQRFLELKERGAHFNEDLASKNTFRNPSLLAAMMERAGVDEADQYNTSLPAGLWDPLSLPEWAYKEALLKSQQELREKNEAAKKNLSEAGKRTIEFTSASNSNGSSRHSTPNQHSKRPRPR